MDPGLRSVFFTFWVWAMTLFFSSVLWLRTRWQSQDTLPLVGFLVLSVTYGVVFGTRPHRRKWRQGGYLIPGGSLLLLAALVRDWAVRPPVPSAYSIGAAILLGACWLAWGFTAKRYGC